MNSKKCIVCMEPFDTAPPEHVIPKSVGGQYTIHSVCEVCNGKMNKSIDEPFKEHKLIALYRFVFSVNGRGKHVPDPMSGEVLKIDGIDYRVKLTDDLKLESRQKPIFPKISDLKMNAPFEVVLDGKDLHLLDGFIEKLSTTRGVAKENIKIIGKTETFRPESTAIFMTDNNIAIFEYSKILYETTCDLLGDIYLQDPIAKKYASMLKAGVLDTSMKAELNPNEDITNEVFMQMIPNLETINTCHAIVISGYVGLGLIGFVKIFDTYHVQILSRDASFSSSGMKIVLNDFHSRTLVIYEAKGLPNCSVNINRNYLHDQEQLDLEFQSNPVDQEYPVYNSEGKKIANTIFEFVLDFRFKRQITTDFKSRILVKLFFHNTVCIKSKKTKRILPIESIVYNYCLNTIKRR